MIEATQKKLRETRFFYEHLARESANVSPDRAGPFLFYLSAFLSAGRSVTFALQKEEKEKYDAWFQPIWEPAQTQADLDLMKEMKLQRNISEKEGAAKTTLMWEYTVIIPEVTRDARGHPAYGVHVFAPPGTPHPPTTRAVHHFTFGSTSAEVTEACKRYVDLLENVVRDFIEAHPSP
jgi:hypothetical protein